MTPLNVQDLRRRAEKRAQYWNSASLPSRMVALATALALVFVAGCAPTKSPAYRAAQLRAVGRLDSLWREIAPMLDSAAASFVIVYAGTDSFQIAVANSGRKP